MSYVPGGYEPRREPLGPPVVPIMPTSPAPLPYLDSHNNLGPARAYLAAPGPTPPKKRRTGLIIGLALAAVVLLAGGVVLALGLMGKSPVSIPGLPQTFTVQGHLTVSGCNGSAGYSDIRSGTEVTITDESGKVLGIGQLVEDGLSCTFRFTVDKVPAGDKFYGISVSHRGTLHYTEAQMRQDVELSLG